MQLRGGFVEVRNNADGVAKIVETSGTRAEIEYFVSPAGPKTHRLQVPIAQLRPVTLSAQTRVYLFDEKQSAWRIGRVDAGLVDAKAVRLTEDHYHVRFPNGLAALIPCSKLYTRWSHPIEDPTDHVAARITDTPFFYDARRQIVRYLAGQRASFGGLTGLASSGIELLEHQIMIARRILSDPIERYLLADEVGLGKTIEAGILIRQHVLDRPSDAAVLVVVPPHLKGQWAYELERKFFLAVPSPVQILSEEEVLNESNSDGHFTMLIVDEAHRAALHAFSGQSELKRLYQRLRELSVQVPRVVLLSATPVLHNEDGFLAMLHLLDPNAYRLDNRRSFRLRVQERQTIADAIVDLADDASGLFAEEAISRLREKFSSDGRLAELAFAVSSLLNRSTDDAERRYALGRLRRYLVETYRLDRRILRTRRDDARVRDLLPQRVETVVIEYEDSLGEHAAEAIESWRRTALYGDNGGRPEVAALFALLVEAVLSHPRVLYRRIATRLGLPSGHELAKLDGREQELLRLPWVFEGERDHWAEQLELLASALEHDARVDSLVAWQNAESATRKVVVFCGDVDVADRVTVSLRTAVGAQSVVRYVSGGDADRTFESNPQQRVLVCDSTGEEGLNLQRVGAVMVHYDLPLEPTRIEQRIGRVDRIDAARNVRNVVFDSHTRYETEWLRCLCDAVRIFEQSVAPLQYVLLDATTRIRQNLFSDGPSAIEAETNRMKDPKLGLEAELRRIRAQEALDAAEVASDAERKLLEGLEDGDASAERDGPQALDGWLVERLQFQKHKEQNAVRYIHVTTGRRPTLSPLFDIVQWFEPLIDRRSNVHRFAGQLPLVPFTFNRVVSEKEAVPLLRAGHPFLAAMEAMMHADDRGAAFAMWRVERGIGLAAPSLFFRFDFVIQADIAAANSIALGHGGEPEAVRRWADAEFPVQYHTVWLDSDLESPTDRVVLAALERPYRPIIHGGSDLNLRPDRWPAVDAAVAIGDWEGLCLRARRVAEDRVRNSTEFIDSCYSHAMDVRDKASAVNDVFRSRIAQLSGAQRVAEEARARFEAEISEAIALGIEKPSFHIDVAGTVFLSPTTLPELTS